MTNLSAAFIDWLTREHGGLPLADGRQGWRFDRDSPTVLIEPEALENAISIRSAIPGSNREEALDAMWNLIVAVCEQYPNADELLHFSEDGRRLIPIGRLSLAEQVEETSRDVVGKTSVLPTRPHSEG